MPVVVNSNASATSASFNLSRANDSLRKSLERLSSGNRINSSADDAGGLAVAYKLNSKLNRTEAVIQNSQNALSYLQVQDSGLQTVGKILDRMAELRVMAQDITKNSSDIENYSKEFVELQSQLKQIKQEKFNGISLFSQEQTAAATGSLVEQSTTIGNDTFDKFGRILTTHPNGESASGSISLNVVNLQYVLSIGTLAVQTGGTDKDLGGLDNGTVSSNGIDANGFIADILDVNVSQFTRAIERLADMRAENGAEQNRVLNSIDLLQTSMTNLKLHMDGSWTQMWLWNLPGLPGIIFLFRQVPQ